MMGEGIFCKGIKRIKIFVNEIIKVKLYKLYLKKQLIIKKNRGD